MLGYVDAARLDANLALKEAREIGQAFPLMHALAHTLFIHLQCGDHAAANAESDELLALANEKGTLFWKAVGKSVQGCLLAAAGKPADAIQMITSGIAALRLTGSTLGMPAYLSCLAIAYAELGQFENARRIIGDAMQAAEKTKETWREAEIYRIAGEIALLSPAPDLVKAATYFERGLAIARRQQAKMWELRVEMSLARLRRNLGKRGEARDHLASVLDWFTEGFDTLDLRQARILLDSLASDGDRMDDSLVCTTYPGLCF
jgi:predicted ATPase